MTPVRAEALSKVYNTVGVPAHAVREQAPCSYRLHADLSMEGDWLLALNAKGPGEQESIRGSIPIKAVPTKAATWTTQGGE
ncbi:MAG: hypothetical protein HY423_10575 [Candidatus Lambdaproteobacteria bacterium]|nr:hypothetical protein [Candidatus Lambdaproteobacteria bacterium]